jgi:hypothetical protein
MIAVIAAARRGRYGGFVRNTILHPARPERVCWGCEKFCPAHDLACGNGTIRTPHPSELFGDDWLEWSAARNETSPAAETPAPEDSAKTRET